MVLWGQDGYPSLNLRKGGTKISHLSTVTQSLWQIWDWKRSLNSSPTTLTKMPSSSGRRGKKNTPEKKKTKLHISPSLDLFNAVLTSRVAEVSAVEFPVLLLEIEDIVSFLPSVSDFSSELVHSASASKPVGYPIACKTYNKATWNEL